jgi:hypothetical protein
MRAEISPGLKTYSPLKGEPRPEGQLKLSKGRNGRQYITTGLTLTGRGIFLEVDNRISKQKTYRVTKKALDSLKAQHSIVEPLPFG